MNAVDKAEEEVEHKAEDAALLKGAVVVNGDRETARLSRRTSQATLTKAEEVVVCKTTKTDLQTEYRREKVKIQRTKTKNTTHSTFAASTRKSP